MHLTESELAELIHSDAAAISEMVSAHLSSCPDCSARLEILRGADREVAGLLRGLDHPRPGLGSAVFLDDLERRRRRVGAIAAGLALCVAGAAAALPNSPLHDVLRRAFSRSGGNHAPASIPAGKSVRPEAGVGVAFIPGSSLDVRFSDPQPGGHLRILFVDGPRMSAIADGNAAFSIHQSQLEVSDRGVAMAFTLEIPRTVPDVNVSAGKETIFEKRGGTISAPYSTDSSGAYNFHLGDASPARVPRFK